jgi:hypothetical protein
LKQKFTLGRKDKAKFPELGLVDIDIKMDTGAFTSAIHCHKIGKKTINGKDVVVFTLLDPSHPQYNNQEFTVENYLEKRIKNSFGSSEKRFVIKTVILLFGKKHSIELSLSERGEMKFPILIGRRFLMGKFIVDSARYDLSYKRRQKKLLNKLNNSKTNET